MLKEEIRKDMSRNGIIRVLICTNSAGMGVNYSHLSNVIHYGLPHDMDTFVQQMGRAGRDGDFSHELILFKVHKGMLKKIDTELIQLAKDSQCRHKILCDSYGCSNDKIVPLHNCCDICERNCCCEEETCPQTHLATSLNQLYCTDQHIMERSVSDAERTLLKEKLLSFKFCLCDSINLISGELMHGLTDKVIDDIVEKSNKVFIPDDIMNSFPIWSYDIAEKVWAIFNEVFGDNEMYNFELDIDDSD